MPGSAQTRLLAASIVLLTAAWVIHTQSLWGRLANLTVPWLCTALALVLVVTVTVCALRGQRPGELPWLVVAGVVLVVPGVLLVGVFVDREHYGSGSDFWGSLWEIGGFAALLLLGFVVARGGRAPSAG